MLVTPSTGKEHLVLMQEAVELEAEGHRLLLADDPDGRARMAEAAARYRDSWERAPAAAIGRLLGMLKAAVIAGGGGAEAAYARAELAAGGDSPSAWYALAIAALVEGDDAAAARAAEEMRGGSDDAFARAADAVAALAAHNAEAYAAAIRSIVADFEQRTDHLTGVAFADTAAMFEALAERRGLAARPSSPLLPQAGR